MARIKVLLIVTLSELGGAQKVVYNIAAGLPPEQFEVTVACAPGGELVNWLRNLAQGIQVIEISELKRYISLWDDLKAFMKLYALIKKGAFDIVHCHSSKAGILGRLAAYLVGVPKIFFTAHGWVINEYQSRPVRFFYTWAERLAGVVSTKVVCVSESDLLKGRNLRLAANDKLEMIYNGVPVPRKKEGVLRGALNITQEDIVIGTVARLAPQKDPLFLLEVAGQMLTCPDHNQDKGRLYFVIIGDGPLRARCEEFISLKDLNSHVFLMGTREDAAELVCDFDVFVLFSRWEGLPLTIIEAMQAGRPVVASAVGGVSELVVHQKTGFLINGRDERAAVQALRKLAADQEQRLSMGESGRQRAVELFSVNEMVNKYRELYLSK